MAKRRQYGTGSVHQRKADGRWIGSVDAGYTTAGKRRRISVTAKTEAECKRKLRDKIAQMESGVVTTASVRTTVKAWSDQWLEVTQHTHRPKTWITNRSGIRQWVVPMFGHKRLGDITPADVDAMKDAMRAAGRSNGTMSRTQNVLNRMLKDAIIAGHKIHPGVILVKKTSAGKSDRKAIPIKQALPLLVEIEAEPDPSRWVAVILNGMRQGERNGLTRDLIDWDKKQFDVSWQLQELNYKDNRNKHLGFRVPDGYEKKQLVGRYHLTRPKTAAGQRIIPMTPWMESSLRGWLAIAPDSPHGLVWCNADGSPIDPKIDRSEWYRLQDQAMISHPTGRPYAVHEGRHTTITMLSELGVPKDVIEQIVGQSKLVEDYVHTDMVPKARAALESLANQLALGTRS